MSLVTDGGVDNAVGEIYLDNVLTSTSLQSLQVQHSRVCWYQTMQVINDTLQNHLSVPFLIFFLSLLSPIAGPRMNPSVNRVSCRICGTDTLAGRK